MPQKAVRYLVGLLYVAAALGAVWLAARYLLPWLAPFILAFVVAAVIEPAVKSMCRAGWSRGIAAGILTLTVVTLIVALAAGLVSAAVSAATDFAGQMPGLMDEIGKTLQRLESTAFSYAQAAPEGVSEYLRITLEAVAETIYGLPGMVSQRALDAAARAAQSSPGMLLFVVTAGIGTYFISATYPKTVAFVSAQLPHGFRMKMNGLGSDMKDSFGGWLKAQLILMAITFFELLVAFVLLKVRGAAGVAAVTAAVDALPVFGTGVVLVPWALYCLLLGDTGRAIGLAICWGMVNLVRNCVQAKLLGDQIGLDPIVSLLAIYVGWKVWGVWGMVLFPLLFVALQRLNEKGVIKLWRNP